jgi:hypothetical protein
MAGVLRIARAHWPSRRRDRGAAVGRHRLWPSPHPRSPAPLSRALRRTNSTYGRRPVPLSERVSQALWRSRGTSPDEAPVFPSRRGAHLDPSNVFSRVLKPAQGRPVSPEPASTRSDTRARPSQGRGFESRPAHSRSPVNRRVFVFRSDNRTVGEPVTGCTRARATSFRLRPRRSVCDSDAVGRVCRRCRRGKRREPALRGRCLPTYVMSQMGHTSSD